MLIIDRKISRGFRIIDRDTGRIVAQIDLLGIRGNRASLGIEATQQYRVLRDEIEFHFEHEQGE